MSEQQSIRDELAREIREYMPGTDGQADSLTIANALLASPVIRRIQAEALRDARADMQAYTDAGSPFGYRPIEEFLDNRADRIEKGEQS